MIGASCIGIHGQGKMESPKKVQVLRIYVGSHLNLSSQIPVFESLLNRARMMKLSGATIFRCQKGFGSAELKGSSAYRMSIDEPIMLEIIDAPDKIGEFIPAARELLNNRGLMTLHSVEIIHQGGVPEVS